MAEYGTILTALGERLIAAHLLEGGKLELAALAVGDGGGAAYQPDAGMTALRGERWRGALNRVEISGESPNVIVIDAIIPAEVGGFTIREAGVFDAAGNLVGLMNTPATQKVASADGATTEQYIQMLLAVTSAEGVQITVDGSLVMATRRELEEHNTDTLAHADLRELIEAGETAREALAAHNVDAAAHGDIRAALAGKAESAALAAHNAAGDAHGDIRAALSGKAESAALTAHDAAGDAHGDIRTALSGKAESAALTAHNTAGDAHADIRSSLASKASQSDLESVRSAAATAQSTANTANTTANAAMPKAGGTFTGNVMSNNPAVGTQAIRNIYAGTGDLTAGSTGLATGLIYFVYE